MGNRESARIPANLVPLIRTLTSLRLVRGIACLSAMLKARACSRHSPTLGGMLVRAAGAHYFDIKSLSQCFIFICERRKRESSVRRGSESD